YRQGGGRWLAARCRCRDSCLGSGNFTVSSCHPTAIEGSAMTASKPAIPASNSQRSAWLKTLHQWHWISSALCLLCILLFSFTGITLNHAAQIESKPEVALHKADLPPELLD